MFILLHVVDISYEENLRYKHRFKTCSLINKKWEKRK